MRELILGLTLFILLGMLPALSAQDATSLQPLIMIPKLASSPAIDGRMDDAQWKQAAKVPYLLRLPNWTVPVQATEVYAFYTDSALCVGFDCHESEMSKVSSTAVKRDEGVFHDDVVEVFLKIDPNGEAYYHLACTAAGVTYEGFNKEVRESDETWNPDWKVATFRGSDGWQAEMEIPFRSLGLGTPSLPTAWRINFCREERPVGEDTTWSLCRTRFHEPESFGTLVFGGDVVPIVDIREFLASANGIIERMGEITNTSRSAVDIRLDTYVPVGSKRRLFSLPLPLDPLESQKFRLADDIRDEGRMVAVVEASLGGTVFYRTLRPFEVPLIHTRLSDLSRRLKGLEESVRRMSGQASVWLANNTGAIRLRRDAIAQSAEFAAEATPGQIDALVRSLDGLEQSIRVAELVAKIQELKISMPEGSEFIAWPTDPWTQLRPYDYPTELSLNQEIHAIAYRGEKVYAATNITNLTETTIDVRVEPPAFKNGTGSVSVPARSVEMRISAYIKEDSESDALLADALPLADQAGRLVIPPYRTEQVFLVIETTGLKPDDYVGTLSIRPTTGNATQSVPVWFKVYPLDLPDEPKPRLCTWGSIINIPWARPNPKAYLEDAVEHGVNVFAVGASGIRPELDKDGNITKPVDYTSYDALVKAYNPHGIIGGIYSIGIEYDRSAKKAGLEYMGHAYRKGFITWFRDWIAHLKGLGLDYKDMLFEVVDEPAPKELFRLHMDIGRLIREADPNARIVTTTNFKDVARIREINEVVDIWVPSGGVLENADARKAMKDTGKEMWVYVCEGDSKRLDPVNYYRHLAWQAFRYNLSGWGFFAHMWRMEHPWESRSSEKKRLATYSAVYPGTNGPVTSRRWEAYWKGHEDFRALHLLKRLVADGEKAGFSGQGLSDARKVLEEAVNASAVLADMKDKGTSERSRYLEELRIKVADASLQLAGELEKK